MINYLSRFFLLLSLYSLLISACGVQVTATPLPKISQEALSINFSPEVVTSTPAPDDTYIGDAVPLALRRMVEGENVSTLTPVPSLETGEGEGAEG